MDVTLNFFFQISTNAQLVTEIVPKYATIVLEAFHVPVVRDMYWILMEELAMV